MRLTVSDLICRGGTMTATVVDHQETNDVDKALAEAYLEIGVPVDRLPYSVGFDDLVCLFNDRLFGLSRTPQQTWTRLIKNRKSGKLPRLNGKAPKLTDDLPSLDKFGNVPEAVIDNDSLLRGQTSTAVDA